MSQMLTESVTLSTVRRRDRHRCSARCSRGAIARSRRCRRRSSCGRWCSASASPALVGLFFGLYPARARRALDPDRGAEARVMERFSATASHCSAKIVVMAFDTLRTNKMRSALTVLGVVIGITSIVGMTSLIRGFDESLRDMITRARAEHDLRAEVRRVELFVAARASSSSLRRPNLTVDDARAIEKLRRPSAARGHLARRGTGQPTHRARVLPRRAHADRCRSSATTEQFADGELRQDIARPVLHRAGSAAPAARRRARQQPVPGAVREDRHRSDRQEGAHRRDRVHGRRRARQAPGGGRLQPRPGRLRGHPLHDVSTPVRYPSVVRTRRRWRPERA